MGSGAWRELFVLFLLHRKTLSPIYTTFRQKLKAHRPRCVIVSYQIQTGRASRTSIYPTNPLNGFEQIDYTMNLAREVGSGQGIVGQMISQMPDMKEILEYWNAASDHAKAIDADLLIPIRFKSPMDTLQKKNMEASSQDSQQITPPRWRIVSSTLAINSSFLDSQIFAVSLSQTHHSHSLTDG